MNKGRTISYQIKKMLAGQVLHNTLRVHLKGYKGKSSRKQKSVVRGDTQLNQSFLFPVLTPLTGRSN